MLINTAEGSYSPSFFTIFIDTTEDIHAAVEKNEQTFIHEYIHFLQDILLAYCIRLNMTSLGHFSCINTYAVTQRKLVRPFTNWNDDSKITIKQYQYTWGDSQFVDTVNSITDIIISNFIIPTGQKVYKYTLNVSTPESTSMHYQIGARDFLEYIAHKIESVHWDTNAPDFPYKTVDKIFEHYELSDIPTEIRIKIVEYCLYNDNPIRSFMNLFIENGEIRNNKDIFLSASLCEKYLLNMAWHSRGNFTESIHTKTQRRLKDFRNLLGNQYIHPQFSDIKLWVENVAMYSEKHMANKLFFSELYSMGQNMFFAEIQILIDDLGIPLVMNRNCECLSMLPPSFDISQFGQFYTMQQFMLYIESKSTCCPIVNFCKANDPEHQLINISCYTTPHLIASEEELCPFKLFLKSYGIDAAEFTIERIIKRCNHLQNWC